MRAIPLLLVACLIFFHSVAQQARPYVIILGTAQDGGYPHAGCVRQCCRKAWNNESLRQYVVSFALVDSSENQWWLFEATPDIKYQLQYFNQRTKGRFKYVPDGIFITHAHIGHYTGLMEFGKEVMNTKKLPVYVLPKMDSFLRTNGPWSQLVNLGNISIIPLFPDSLIKLNTNIAVEAFTVPHRDEYSETAGFRIVAGRKSYLFIPDIDKWQKWDRNIIDEVKNVDIALVDATFYDGDELPDRKISEVPHPFVAETVELFKNETADTKGKVYFIHFNHTNPLLWNERVQEQFNKSRFNIVKQGMIL